MIVDSSAVLAILRREPEADRFVASIGRATRPQMSAASVVEAGIVAEASRGEAGGRDLDLLLAKLGIEVATFTSRQADLARKAWRRYGKGRDPARLNFGDCLAYALAKDTGEPLLFKGGDFSQTDIAKAAY